MNNLRIGRLTQQRLEHRLQMLRHRPWSQHATVQFPDRPDSNTRVGEENLIRSLQILSTQLALPYRYSGLTRFTQNDSAHNAGHTTLIDARREDAGLAYEKHVTQCSRHEIAC